MKKALLLLPLAAVFSTVFLAFSCDKQPAYMQAYWYDDGVNIFQTNQLDRAQDEIPFGIIVPEYMPVLENHVPKLGIQGTLRESQTEGEAYVELLYILEPGQKTTGIIIITEMETPISSANPEEIIYINGKRIERNSGNYSLGSGFYYFFDGNDIYFKVELYKISDEEAFKVVESLVGQLD